MTHRPTNPPRSLATMWTVIGQATAAGWPQTLRIIAVIITIGVVAVGIAAVSGEGPIGSLATTAIGWLTGR